jgi:hypothetical protein
MPTTEPYFRTGIMDAMHDTRSTERTSYGSDQVVGVVTFRVGSR